jgi:hypothetical protein
MPETVVACAAADVSRPNRRKDQTFHRHFASPKLRIATLAVD